MKSSKKWLATYLICWTIMLGAVIALVVYIDPNMHYHKPFTDRFYYHWGNQRSINDGIIRQYDYDAILTGSSEADNFKPSIADQLFDVKSIKITYDATTYKEINDNLERALKKNPKTKMVIRVVDTNSFFQEADELPFEKSYYPEYLYNSNPFDDVKYIFNRTVLYETIGEMLLNSKTGITDMDHFSWAEERTEGDLPKRTYGSYFIANHIPYEKTEQWEQLCDDDKERIRQNIIQNITSVADKYPQTQFYYLIPPYSAAWWWDVVQKAALLNKERAAEEYIIEMLLQHENIHLFSWNDQFWLTTNLNNYKDVVHYGPWVNEWMLYQVKQGNGLLTKDNYQEYLQTVYGFYEEYDFNELLTQEDDPNDAPPAYFSDHSYLS